MSSSSERLRGLKLGELEIFEELAATQSVREVARRRGLSAGQVSKTLRAIEKRLGAKLVERSSQGILLNRDGLELRKAAKRVLEALPALENLRGDSDQRERPVLSFAATSYLNQHVLIPALGRLGRGDPGFRARILELPTDDMVHLGLRGVLSAALHVGPLAWPGSWTTLEVGPLPWKLYARRGHPVGASSTEARVLEYPFVLPTYWEGDGFANGDDQCPVPASKRVRGFEVSSAEHALRVVAQSDQLTFAPAVSPRAGVRQVRVRGWPEVTRPIYFSVRAEFFPQKVFEKMRMALPKIVKELGA